MAGCLIIAAVFVRADEFNIIHNGFDLFPLTYSDLVDTSVMTRSTALISTDRPFYERDDTTITYMAISDADDYPRLHLLRHDPPRHRHRRLSQYAQTIGVHLLFFGRIHPDNGTAHAIEVARRSGRRPG